MTTMMEVVEEQFELFERFLKPKISGEALRYCIAGILVVSIDLGTYYAALPFCSVNVAKGLAFFAGGVTGYFLHKYWTFVNVRWSTTEPIRFAVINFLTFGINIFTNQEMLSIWPGALFAAWIVTTAVTGVVSYLCCKLWVFKISSPRMIGFK